MAHEIEASKMTLALIVYNRPDHLRQVIDALRPQEPSLYVFCDGPKSDVDQIKVYQARAELTKIDWARPVQFMRPENVGLAESIVGAADGVLSQEETVIVLEDDCVPGPYFMEFMEKCLELYKDDPQVLCVTGYTVNIPIKSDYDCYFFPRTETWGWGTWREKWKLYRRDIGQAFKEGQNLDLRRGGPDVPAMIDARVRGVSQSWSPGWMMAAYLNDMVCVYPTVSHIQNIGMDDSGTHCGKSERWKTSIAQEPATRFPKTVVENQEIHDHVWNYHATY